MDLNINQRRLPPPNNIQISCPKGPQGQVVTWDIIRNPEQNIIDSDIVEIGYNVYRGISANGIFYKQNQIVLKTNRFEDINISKNPNTVNWYKVSTTYLSKTTNKWIEGQLSSPVIYQVLNNNKWFKKVNERNLWILKNTGQLFDLYTRKYEGEKCTKCYDPIRGRAATTDCDVCYGTGFVGGYEPQFQLYVRQKPAQTDLGITPEGYVYNNTPGAWTISTIMIKNRDILINPQGQLFTVLSSHVNQAAGYLFHQELMLKELDPTDPLYKMKRVALYPNL